MEKLLLSDQSNVLGLCVKRCNIRRVHGDVENIDEDGFDINQESVLLPCSVIKIKNKWDDYYYIKSHVGEGWVPSHSIAVITHAKAEEFLFPESFCIITEPTVTLCGREYSMSCKIPIKNGLLQLPFYDDDSLYIKTCQPKYGCHPGYLHFSRQTVISQAIKFLETPYDWGEKSGGLDCSSLIMYSFAVCGINLPRSSSEQAKITFPVNAYSVNNVNLAKPADIIYMPGHIMLSLGGRYILHASSTAGKVCVTKL